MDSRRKPPVRSSPLPSRSTAPIPIRAPICASGPALTSRERRRLRSPSSASGKRRYSSSAMSRPSTASPRNSSRSLLSSVALRCVSAARNSAGCRGSRPSSSCSQAEVASCAPGAVISLPWLRMDRSLHRDALVEVHQHRDAPEQLDLVFVVGLDEPLLAVSRHGNIVYKGIVDAFDVPASLQCLAHFHLVQLPIALEFRGCLGERSIYFHVIEVHRRQPDHGITDDRYREKQEQPAYESDAILTPTHACLRSRYSIRVPIRDQVIHGERWRSRLNQIR